MTTPRTQPAATCMTRGKAVEREMGVSAPDTKDDPLKDSEAAEEKEEMELLEVCLFKHTKSGG